MELKPCPFCGSTRIYHGSEPSGNWMDCDDCGCKGPFCWHDEDEEKAWNQRTEQESKDGD